MAYSVKAMTPAPTTISVEQIRALHALGLIIAPAGSIPHSDAPKSQRQADEKCQKAVGLIHQHLAEYQEHRRGEAPLLQVIDAPMQAAAAPAADKTSPTSPPKSAHKKKKKLYKTTSELGKRRRPEIAFSQPSKKLKGSTIESNVHGSSEFTTQQLPETSKTAASMPKSVTASLPSPVGSNPLSATVSTTTASLPSSRSPGASPKNKKEKKHRKSKKDKKRPQEQKEVKEKKHHKHHKRHSSRASPADTGDVSKQASHPDDSVSVLHKTKELTSPRLSAVNEPAVAGKTTISSKTIDTNTSKAQDSGRLPKPAKSFIKRSGDHSDAAGTPVPEPVTPVQTLTKLVPKSRPSTNLKEPAPRPRYEHHNSSPLRPVTSEADEAMMQRQEDSAAPPASHIVKDTAKGDETLAVDRTILVSNQAHPVPTTGVESVSLAHDPAPAITACLPSACDQSQGVAAVSDDSDDESDTSADSALKSFLPPWLQTPLTGQSQPILRRRCLGMGLYTLTSP